MLSMARATRFRGTLAPAIALAVMAAGLPAWAGPLDNPEIRSELERLEAEAVEVTRADAMEFLAAELPEAIARLEALRREASSPSAEAEVRFERWHFEIHMARLALELQETKENRPEAYPKFKHFNQLELKSDALADRYHRVGNEEERARIKEELVGLLEESFELSQELREIEAKQIEAELKRIWAILEQRRKNKDLIIERRLSELIQGQDPFEW